MSKFLVLLCCISAVTAVEINTRTFTRDVKKASQNDVSEAPTFPACLDDVESTRMCACGYSICAVGQYCALSIQSCVFPACENNEITPSVPCLCGRNVCNTGKTCSEGTSTCWSDPSRSRFRAAGTITTGKTVSKS